MECVWPLKLQYTWLSGYFPFVRLRTLTVRTFRVGGMFDVSPQKSSSVGGVVDPAVCTAMPNGGSPTGWRGLSRTCGCSGRYR